MARTVMRRTPRLDDIGALAVEIEYLRICIDGAERCRVQCSDEDDYNTGYTARPTPKCSADRDLDPKGEYCLACSVRYRRQRERREVERKQRRWIKRWKEATRKGLMAASVASPAQAKEWIRRVEGAVPLEGRENLANST